MSDQQPKRTVLCRIPLDYVPGYELRTLLLEYPAGMAAPLHTHPIPGSNYVIQGTVVSKFENDPEERFTVGQTFIDEANRSHLVTNGSDTEGFKVVVSYVVKFDEPNVVMVQ